MKQDISMAVPALLTPAIQTDVYSGDMAGDDS